jgi:hypothetical protein
VQQPPPAPPPVIVKLMEPETELSGLADVLLGALGLSGVLLLCALVLGLATGAIVFWVRSRSSD